MSVTVWGPGKDSHSCHVMRGFCEKQSGDGRQERTRDLPAVMSNAGFILWAMGSNRQFRVHRSVAVIMTLDKLS